MQNKIQTKKVFVLSLALFLSCVAGNTQKHPPTRPIDLNIANAKELQQLPGIGKVTAQRIVDMRQKSGRFRRVEDLLAIRGISQKKLDVLRPYVTISAPLSPPAQKSSPPAKRGNP